MRKITLGLLIFTSCTTGKVNNEFFLNTKNIKEADFENYNASYRVIKLNDISGVHHIMCMGFIPNNEIAVIDDHLSISILNSQYKKIQDFNSNNNPEPELISPTIIFKMGPRDFGIYDLTLDRIYYFSKKPTAKKWNLIDKRDLIPQLRGLISINSFDSTLFSATSINNIQGRLLNFELTPQQKLVNYIGPKINIKGNSDFLIGMAYRCSAVFDEHNHNTYLCYYYTDLIEAYDANGKFIFRIRGPECFEPIYREAGDKKDQQFSEIQETKVAYTSIVSDDRFIYVLYSGRDNSLNKFKTKQKIYIFDKGGRPYKKIILNIEIEKLMFDSVSGQLYGFKPAVDNTTDNNLVIFNLKI